MDLAADIADWLSLLAIIITFIISVNHREKRVLFPIQVYIVLSLIINIILKATFIFPIKDIRALLFFSMNVYSLLEITLLYYFLYYKIKNKGFRSFIILFFFVYLTTCIIMWTSIHRGIFTMIPSLYGFENLLIIFVCLFYMYEV